MSYNNNNKNFNRNSNKAKNNSNKEKKSNENFTLNLYDKGISGTRVYDYNSLVQILNRLDEDGIFGIISIPVYMYRSDVTNKPTMKGTTQVGFVRSASDGTVEASVFASYVDYIKAFDNPIVYPRVVVRDDEVATIIGLDICEAARFAEDEVAE